MTHHRQAKRISGLLFALLLLGLAAQALAYKPLADCEPRWAPWRIPAKWSLNIKCSGDVPFEACRAALVASFTTWSNVACSHMRWNYVGGSEFGVDHWGKKGRHQPAGLAGRVLAQRPGRRHRHHHPAVVRQQALLHHRHRHPLQRRRFQVGGQRQPQRHGHPADRHPRNRPRPGPRRSLRRRRRRKNDVRGHQRRQDRRARSGAGRHRRHLPPLFRPPAGQSGRRPLRRGLHRDRRPRLFLRQERRRQPLHTQMLPR